MGEWSEEYFKLVGSFVFARKKKERKLIKSRFYQRFSRVQKESLCLSETSELSPSAKYLVQITYTAGRTGFQELHRKRSLYYKDKVYFTKGQIYS